MSQDVLRGHEFDGITEFDNRLPNWWLWTFYLACIFSFVYWIHYHVLRTGPSPQQEFRAEMAAFEIEMEKRSVDDGALEAMASDSQAVAAGREVFQTNCIACHGVDGGGTAPVDGLAPVLLPGPNLTDRYWKHGGKPSELYATVVKGVPNTAMVAWGTVLGPSRCQEVVAYLLTLRNTDVAGGKAPEGEDVGTR